MKWTKQTLFITDFSNLLDLPPIRVSGHFPDGYFPDGHIPDGHFPDGHFPDGRGCVRVDVS